MTTKLFVLVALSSVQWACRGLAQAADGGGATGVEKIVFVRHGEKPAADLGQLTCQGLNRALALPEVLISHYGRADFIFAPLTQKKKNHSGARYSYIRPLMTIEPTAIRLGLPVDTTFAYDAIGDLQSELLTPKYQKAIVFVAWEHKKLEEVVKTLLESLGGDSKTVPIWPEDDFDSIYVLQISTGNGPRAVSFQHDHEGLNAPPMDCPEAGKQ